MCMWRKMQMDAWYLSRIMKYMGVYAGDGDGDGRMID